jgi:hypothetical protein
MRMMRLVVATAATLAATVTMTPAAQADTVVFADARGDAPRHIDLTTARVDNGDTRPQLVLMRIRIAGRWQLGDQVSVWFNRDRSNPGPELRLTAYVDSEYVLRRVETWNGPGRRASCERYSMKQFANNRGLRVRIARDCLGNRPARVAIRTMSENGRVDWFQQRRSFLPAVHR